MIVLPGGGGISYFLSVRQLDLTRYENYGGKSKSSFPLLQEFQEQ